MPFLAGKNEETQGSAGKIAEHGKYHQSINESIMGNDTHIAANKDNAYNFAFIYLFIFFAPASKLAKIAQLRAAIKVIILPLNRALFRVFRIFTLLNDGQPLGKDQDKGQGWRGGIPFQLIIPKARKLGLLWLSCHLIPPILNAFKCINFRFLCPPSGHSAAEAEAEAEAQPAID